MDKISFASRLDLDSEDLRPFPKFCGRHGARDVHLEVALLDQAESDVGRNFRRCEGLPKLFR